jgi:hypothetical protein
MEIPAEAQRRIAGDDVAWLTTVADSGAPAPNPVWFVPDGGDLLVFSTPRPGRLTRRREPSGCSPDRS